MQASLESLELEALGGEELVGAIRGHARALAESAFWDSVTACTVGSAASQRRPSGTASRPASRTP